MVLQLITWRDESLSVTLHKLARCKITLSHCYQNSSLLMISSKITENNLLTKQGHMCFQTIMTFTYLLDIV